MTYVCESVAESAMTIIWNGNRKFFNFKESEYDFDDVNHRVHYIHRSKTFLEYHVSFGCEPAGRWTPVYD